MIRTAVIEEMETLAHTDETLLRIGGAARVYGVDRPFCRFWVNDDGGVLMVSEGIATLHLGESFEEWAVFLTMSPDVHTVRTDAATAEKLAQLWNVQAVCGHVMRGENVLLCGNAAEAEPAALYPLICEVFTETIPPFDAWYADVHHRLRRGAFRSRAVCEEGRVLSCAMTVAECPDAVLLGAVATHPAARGKGLASACVTALTTAYQEEGKTVYISPKNAAAEALYQRLGFVVCGEWGRVSKGKD